MKSNVGKTVAVLAACLMSAVAFGYDWPSSADDCVWLKTSDTTRNSSSIQVGGHWSMNGAPQSGYDYWVPSGKTIYGPNAATAFQGDSLTIAGKYTDFNYATTYAHLRLMGGAQLVWDKANGPIKGEVTIAGSSAKPVEFLLSRGNSSGVTQPNFSSDYTFISAAGERIDIIGKGSVCSNTVAFSGADFSDYQGEINFTRDPTCAEADVQLTCRMKNSVALPGAVTLGDGWRIYFDAATLQLTCGTLTLKKGSTLQVDSRATAPQIVISEKLVVEPGAKMRLVAYTEAYDTPDLVLFSLTGDAALPENLPDLGNFDMSAYPGNYWGKDRLEVIDGKVILHCGRTKNELVTSSKASGTDYTTDGVDKDAVWKLKHVPTPGENAVVAKDVCFYADLGDYTFPGGAFIHETNTMYPLCSSVTFANYILPSGKSATIEPNGNAVRTRLVSDYFDVRGTSSLHVLLNASISLDAAVCGTGLIRAGVRTGGTGYPDGTIELMRVNEGFSGKFMVYSTNANSTSDKRGNRVMFFMTDARNIGGKMSGFAFDGLTLKDDAIIVGRNSLTFDQENRGIFVKDKFRLVMTNETDNVLTIKVPVTYGGELLFGNDAPTAGRLPVKIAGRGTLAMGGTAKFYDESTQTAVDTPVASRDKLTMVVGKLKPLSKTALDGVSITFGADSEGLEIDWDADEGVRQFGLFNFKSATPLATQRADGTIPVVFAGAVVDDSTMEVERGICTVKTELAESVRGLLAVKKPVKGFKVSVGLADNGDGTTTIKANLSRTGQILLIR